MKYIASDFLHENLILRRLPECKEDCYNKLVCLNDLEIMRNPRRPFMVKHPSKRADRIIKMFWAYQKMEVMA